MTHIAKATPTNPFIGKTLGGKYSIARLIGRGGMGLVHLAKETETERDVVIKMLAPHFAEDQSAVARFEREGRRLAQLFHPNIVELYDLGWEEDQSYIVMEYIDGEPLRHHLGRKGRLEAGEFAPIADQVLSAVAVAHEQKMMLRDIKPSNIMLCERDGKANFVKMLDFGLAKLVDGDDVEVTKAHVIGTAGYLAPEQIKGEATDVRVDVYALGILFFVMLTGRSPVLGENDGAVLYNHVHGEPLRLESTLPEGHAVPDKLIALVHQCMEKNPARRPADAKALSQALRECLPDEAFDLPEASDESRNAIEAYRRSKRKSGKEPHGVENSSSEWTRPHLRKLLEDGTLAEIRAAKPKARPEDSPPLPPKPPPPPRKGKKTVMGLAPAGSAPEPSPRRPPPAKMPASASMERITGERKTLSPLQSKRIIVRPKPKSIVKAEEDAIPEIEIEPDVSPSAQSTIAGLPMVDVDTTPRGRAPAGSSPPPVPSSTLATPARSGRTTTAVVDSPPGDTEPVVEHVTLARSGSTETGIPSVPAALGRTEPQHELVDEALELGGRTMDVSGPVPVRESPSRAIHSDRFGAAVTDAPVRPAWVYVLAGVLGVLIVIMIGYLFATADDVAPPTTVATNDTPAPAAASTTPTPEGLAATPDPSSPPAVTDAELRVEADADAVVFVDGEEMGTGTFAGRVPAGRRHVRVVREGYEPFESDIDLTAGGTESVLVDMVASAKPDPGPRPRASGPSKPGTKPNTRPTQPSKPEPLPSKKPPTSAKPDPLDEPAPKPEPDDGGDDLFIDAPKKKKGSGIFLPVGEK